MKIKDLLFNELLWSKEKIEIINYETDEIIFNIDRFENLYLDDEWNKYKDWSIKWFESRYNKETNESYIRFYIN
jgi:hypothetical protein|nr:MAG TPA: hypothetical protein [Bacteriophage sp.]